MNLASLARRRFGRTAVGVIAIGIVGVSLAAPAFARAPDGDSTDDHESDCWFLQQQYDQDFATAVNSPSGSKAESDALDHMIAVVDAWQSDGCQGDYGDIEEARVAPPNLRTKAAVLGRSAVTRSAATN